MDLSLVIPVRNEAENIPSLAEEIRTVLDAMSLDWECRWIDDGSTDDTLAILKRLHESDSRHSWIALQPSQGQSAALIAGFASTSAPLIATLDGDGQNDPRDLPALYEYLRAQSADMVVGVRRERHDSLLRRGWGRIGNGFRKLLVRDRFIDSGCALRIFHRHCLSAFPHFRGMHRYLPTLTALHGYRVLELPVNHRPRSAGQSKYGFRNRFAVVLFDTLGILWLKRRTVIPRIHSTSSDL
ncbi:MAG: glycosyltransferase family 2 protein [Calditrichota bacterium]